MNNYCICCKTALPAENFDKATNKSMIRCKSCQKEFKQASFRKKRDEDVRSLESFFRREKRKQFYKDYHKAKRKTDPNYKIATNLRSRIHGKIRCSPNDEDWCAIMGCSTRELILYLESKWLSDMNWENYGRNGWHIDHIRPCASFDLTDPEQQKICFHYTNLQPLWAEDNRRKAARWKPEKPDNNK